MRVWGPFLLAAVLLAGLAAHAGESPGSGEISANNLMQHERFWPVRATLTREVSTGQERPTLKVGATGVLIRVEPAGMALVDFGRFGLHRVPVSSTDIVSQANGVRAGQIRKRGPNVATLLGPRLLLPGAPGGKLLDLEEISSQRGFLLVAADPEANEFAGIVEAVNALPEIRGVMWVLMTSRPLEGSMAEKVAQAGWSESFLIGRFGPSFVPMLFPNDLEPPAVLLTSAEGRLLFAAAWSADGLEGLKKALHDEFGQPLERPTAAIGADLSSSMEAQR